MNTRRVAFPLFVRIARVSAWLDATYTPLGRLFGALLVASALFATDPSRTRASLLLAMLTSLFLVARVANVGWRPALRISRVLPTLATTGVPVRYTLRLTNVGDQPEPAFDVRDTLEQPEPARDALASFASNVDGNDNWFDRRIGFRRWQRLRRLLRGGRIAPQTVRDLAAGDTCEVPLTLTPLRRGRLRFTRAEFARTDPLGIAYQRIQSPCADVLMVLPRHYPLPTFARWLAGDGPRSGHAALDRYRAGGADFHSLREYRHGDSWRHVHWRASARRGEIVVRQFTAQGRPPVSILLDAAGDAALLEAALSVVTSLVAAAVLHARQVPEVLFAASSGGITRLGGSPAEGASGHALLHALACLQDSSAAMPCPLPRWPVPAGRQVLLVTPRETARPRVTTASPHARARAEPWQVLRIVADETVQPETVPGVYVLRASQLATDLPRLDAEFRRGPPR